MKYLAFILSVFILVHGYTQNPGLNCELGFNDNFNQISQGVTVSNEYSYFLHQESVSSSFFTYSYLKKTDTVGNVVWSRTIMPQFHEITDMKEIVASSDGNVYVLGWGTQYCDVADTSDAFLSKYDENGNQLWWRSWPEQNWFDITVKGLKILDAETILVNYSNNALNPNESKIYTLNSNGYLIDSLTIQKSVLDGVNQFGNFDKIGFKQDSLYGFDNLGNTISTRAFSATIKNSEVFNDTLYVLTSDTLYLLDQDFQILQTTNLPGFSNYSHLKISPTFVEFISNNGNSINIHKLNHNLQSINTQSINNQTNTQQYLDFNNSHISVTKNHLLTNFQSVRYLDFSRQSIENAIINSSDIGILDFQSTQVDISNSGFTDVYTISVFGEVLLKNFGNNLVTDCRLNHLISDQGICQPIVYTAHFSDLNLQPGDSAWVHLGLIHQETNYFQSDSITRELCIYSSHPNYLTDLNVPNDSHCETIMIGIVGLEEINSNSKTRIKITDIMGRETDFKPNSVLIYYYSDGSIQKFFTLH
jgi:hypothetical protein